MDVLCMLIRESKTRLQTTSGAPSQWHFPNLGDIEWYWHHWCQLWAAAVTTESCRLCPVYVLPAGRRLYREIYTQVAWNWLALWELLTNTGCMLCEIDVIWRSADERFTCQENRRKEVSKVILHGCWKKLFDLFLLFLMDLMFWWLLLLCEYTMYIRIWTWHLRVSNRNIRENVYSAVIDIFWLYICRIHQENTISH